jgi:pimeloyl-ACP methyl ester carboxylesterase
MSVAPNRLELPRSSQERLVNTVAGDGLSLNGFSIRPGGGERAGIVWLHGFGVGYDLPECVVLGRELAARGFCFVSGNLRGHDGAAVGWRRTNGRQQVVQAGSWWEIFEESAMDVAAWMAQARSLGLETVVLAGHSFGAVHAAYYLSEGPEHGADGVALISPSFGLRHLDPEVASLAEAMVKENRGRELLPAGSWSRGFGTDTVSAQTYASWWRIAPTLFGPGRTRYADIRCPMLITYGADGDVGSQAEIDYLAGLATSVRSLEGRILPDVHHRYAGGEAVLAAAIGEWIERAVSVRN